MKRALCIGIAAALLLRAAPSLAQNQGETTVMPSALEAPKLVTFVEADYPPEEKAAGKTAVVVLQIAIAETGSVAAVVVVESAGPAFDAAAMAAAKRFVFSPAKRDGKAIPVRIMYRYAFEIREEQVKRTTADFEGVVRASPVVWNW